jgi:hypothetical protein
MTGSVPETLDNNATMVLEACSMTTGKRAARKSSRAAHRTRKAPSTKRWSKRVTQKSDAMNLEAGVFKLRSGRAIAQSLKKSSESSSRRKSSPFRSAMSMLNFEINRAGKNLTNERRQVLNQAKVELRKAFGRPAGK